MLAAPPAAPSLVSALATALPQPLPPPAGLPTGIPPELLRAGSVTLPHGRVIALAPRGVYWAACHVVGWFLCYLVDARGDCHGVWRYVRADAPPAEFERCEREVAMLLDRLDPLPRPHLMR